MKKRAPAATPTQLRLATAAFALACLLHIDRMPLWCSALALAAAAWRLLTAHRPTRLPPAPLRIALTLLLVAAVILGLREQGGLAFGTSLLMCMGAAKLSESHAQRDSYALTGVALFLLLAAILDRQELLRLVPYALVAWLACAALASLGGSSEGERARTALGTSGRALLWALPLTFAAFLLFPRIEGGLWGLPGSDRAQTGLGEEMSPGSISELSVSDAVAFRVHFDGAVPPPQNRYWRGPVLHQFDGYTWRRSFGPAPAEPLERLGDAYTYRVTLEPHARNWWYSLDTIDAAPRGRVQLTYDHQLVTFLPVTSVIAYDATSHLQTRNTGELSQTARRQDTRLPPRRNPRTQALALELHAEAGSTAQFVAAVLARFRDQGFEYTLTPPLLDLDSVDDFLFNTRRGFCGHFASAFANLMRAAGVPARVVTGYQGGEWNPIGGYLLIRQSDAHAWNEVWIDGSGWVRVDPTAAAAPERLLRGLRDLRPDSGNFTSRLVRGNRWLTEALRTWDAANTWWQTRVVQFDRSAQLGLLARLGLPDADYRLLTALLLGAACAWAGIVLWRQRRAPATRVLPPAARHWARLRRALAKAGTGPTPHTAPASLAQQAAVRHPELGALLQAALEQYEQLRYAPAPVPTEKQLLQTVRRIEARLRGSMRDARTPLLAAPEREALAAMPLYRAMPGPLRERTERLARGFLERVPLVGCAGLVIDARMRALIAFQACVLVCTRDLSLYRSLRSVLVYPDEFVVTERHEDDAGVVTEGERALSGQSEDDSRILLSWRDVLAGLEQADGYNVVLHEFAHLLDHVTGGDLSAPGDDPWRSTFSRAYEALCDAVDAGAETLIDPYGAEDQAEFFAVCTETFFELPVDLLDAHPELYGALARFYGVDPARWSDPTDAHLGFTHLQQQQAARDEQYGQ